jgi:hypothetical protein
MDELPVGTKVRACYLGGWVPGFIIGPASEPGTYLVEDDRSTAVRAFYRHELEVVGPGA